MKNLRLLSDFIALPLKLFPMHLLETENLNTGFIGIRKFKDIGDLYAYQKKALANIIRAINGLIE